MNRPKTNITVKHCESASCTMWQLFDDWRRRKEMRMNSLTRRGSHVAVPLSAGPLLVWQSLSRWTWWRGSWGGRGRRSAARRTTPWAWCTCAACSPSCATRLATWPRRSRRRSSTWCCPYLTGWVTAGASGSCTAWSLQLIGQDALGPLTRVYAASCVSSSSKACSITGID